MQLESRKVKSIRIGNFTWRVGDDIYLSKPGHDKDKCFGHIDNIRIDADGDFVMRIIFEDDGAAYLFRDVSCFG